MSGRAKAINAFAQAVSGQAVPLDRGSRLDDLVQAITAIPGLGPWTAHYLALRMGEPDAFPATDLGLRRSLSGRQRMDSRAVEAAADRWRPWRAHAATHLWAAGVSVRK